MTAEFRLVHEHKAGLLKITVYKRFSYTDYILHAFWGPDNFPFMKVYARGADKACDQLRMLINSAPTEQQE